MGIFNTPNSNNFRFASRGIGFHFLTPINKVNGISGKERKKLMRKEKE